IQDGRGLIPHLTRHPQSLAHASRKGAISDRSAVTKVFVGAVGAGETGEVMAFDDACVAAPLGYSLDVDLLARLENIADRDGLSEGQLALATFGKLGGADARGDVGLLEVPAFGSGDAAQLLPAPGHLHGVVAVGGVGFELGYDARTDLDDGDGADASLRIGHLGHPELLSD